MRRCARVGLAWGLLLVLAAPVWAQLTDADIAALQAQGEREGWGFTVSKNPATEYSLKELCGFVIPENWAKGGEIRSLHAQADPAGPLGLARTRHAAARPKSGELRELLGVRHARAAQVQHRDPGRERRRSIRAVAGQLQQRRLGLRRRVVGTRLPPVEDRSLRRHGHPPESAFPYVAYDAPCNCPYPHDYLIQDWAFIGNEYSVPPTANIKQAILDHGPVSAAIYVNSAFQGYSGGIFGLNGSGCSNSECNHAPVLVGWDDNGGTNGYWIMRTPWAPAGARAGTCASPTAAPMSATPPATSSTRVWAGSPSRRKSGLNAEGQQGGPFTPGSVVYTIENTSGIPVNYNVTHARRPG